mmetsp:Transcript_66242/g.142987  ORF Transcript_66242/g.142987 Transcript_66242/m.142987 type:complete len:89 (-) Transcript_66242:2059-2325(-)
MYKWLEDKQSKALQMMEAVSGVSVLKDFEQNEQAWKKYIFESEPQELPIPGSLVDIPWFQKCLVIKALRPEKLMFMMKYFVKDKIGEN